MIVGKTSAEIESPHLIPDKSGWHKGGFLSLILLLLLILPYAHAEERILSFRSSVTVHEDAKLTVKETIRVRAEGVQIKRGIYRDFPTIYPDKEGTLRRVGFNVVGVRKNGIEEPHFTSDNANGVRVYIGSKNVTLPVGEYTYELTYTTDHQIGFFGDFDELYWNVTGNGWDFPIDKAEAEILLPSDAGRKVISTACYTGPEGSMDQDCLSKKDPSGIVRFSATKTLEEREGLTLAVSWPKGYVTPEGAAEVVEQLSDWESFKREITPKGVWGPVLAISGLLLLAGYYLIVWILVGKDPDAGSIVVLYGPPGRMSPAVMRYIANMGFDNKAFAAALINLAVKGLVTIEEEDGEYTIRKKDGGEAVLSPEERTVYLDFFRTGNELKLKQSNHSSIRAAIRQVEEYLKQNYNKIYFVTNRKFFVMGLVLTAVLLFVSGIGSAASKGAIPIFVFICIWLTGWSAGVIVLLRQVVSAWKQVFFGRGFGRFVGLFGALFFTIFAIPFLGGEGFGMYLMATSTSIIMPVFLLAAMAVNYLFFHLLKAPTLAGRKMLDEIEGFKRFLAATEQDRLNTLNPVDRTPQLFEKYLPYALALDVEQQWAEQFSGILDKAATAAEAGGYHPSWYAGPSWHSLGASDFASSLGGSFSNAISSSSTAPGSSSGSGGGGSSGGGGGGGGGGGW